MTKHYFQFSIKILTLVSLFVGSFSCLFAEQADALDKRPPMVNSLVSPVQRFFYYVNLHSNTFIQNKFETQFIAIAFAEKTGGGGGGGGHGNSPG